jgi:glycosyltransferase involved in cell wall biosynthesis
MRIAYIARWDVSVESGVLKKMLDQLGYWQAAGHEVKLFALSRSETPWSGTAGIPVEAVSGVRPLTRPYRFKLLLDQARRWRPTVAYLRFATFSAALESFMRQVPTVAEINTDDLAEYRLYLPRYQYIYHSALRARILRRSQAFIPVSHELAGLVERYDRPMRIIANGIDLSNYRQLPAPHNDRPRLVFLGAPASAWHGVDEIIRWARLTPEWDFELIGTAHSPEYPPNVRAHGILTRQQYERIVAMSDIAVGTLALHRKNMEEASPLKVREYLAFGLPCINGYRDTDFMSDAPFILRLDNRPDNVAPQLARVREFVARWKGRRVPRAPVEHLDLRCKESTRLELLEEAST